MIATAFKAFGRDAFTTPTAAPDIPPAAAPFVIAEPKRAAVIMLLLICVPSSCVF
jgi:hypothetical protein